MQAISYLAALLLFISGALILSDTIWDTLPMGISLNIKNTYDGTAWWVYILIAMFTLFLGYGFYRLARMFGLFAKGRYFSLKGVQHMRIFAISFLALHVFNAIRYQIWAVQYGQFRLFPSVIDGKNISSFILGLTFLIIAHVLNEARKNHEELDSYF